MFVINPGDDIFIPFFLFPITPVNTYLSQDLAWTQIRLTKETKRERSIQDKPCNDKDDYVYGGKRPIMKEKSQRRNFKEYQKYTTANGYR